MSILTFTHSLSPRGEMAQRGDQCLAGPENVTCDFCIGGKWKALKSCVQCQLSFCHVHIQPHYVEPLTKHRLLEASTLHENSCSRHNQEKNIFCRTDQQCICLSCLTEHKGHDIVSVSEEETKKQEELRKKQQEIHKRIQRQEKAVNVLRQKVDAVNRSADKAVEESEKMSNELIKLIKKRSSGVKREIELQREREVGRSKKLQGELQQEITVLKKNKTDLEKLSAQKDIIQFVHGYASLALLPKFTTLPSFNERPSPYFEEVTASVSVVGGALQASCNKEWNKISRSMTEVNVLPLPEPKTNKP